MNLQCACCADYFDFDRLGAVLLAGRWWCNPCWNNCPYPSDECQRIMGDFVIQEQP